MAVLAGISLIPAAGTRLRRGREGSCRRFRSWRCCWRESWRLIAPYDRSWTTKAMRGVLLLHDGRGMRAAIFVPWWRDQRRCFLSGRGRRAQRVLLEMLLFAICSGGSVCRSLRGWMHDVPGCKRPALKLWETLLSIQAGENLAWIFW